MKAKFSIEYYTEWGEIVILVFSDGTRVPMNYTPGALWKAELADCRPSSLKDYHYELERNGNVVRKEWGTHSAKPARGEVECIDSWKELPRMAGVAIPVFSLRSNEDFGVGEFYDLKKMVDWAAATGQHIIQLLPINDTTRSRTWKDSYPYSSISSFALHPMYINLPAAGVKIDKAYKKTQEELNALPQVDYERVNSEKQKLLKKLYAKEGESVLASRACAKFVKDNSEWLKPYADFCAERDGDDAGYHIFVQFHLAGQMEEVREYAHTKGVFLKGDLPIGVSRESVEVRSSAGLFNLDSQAGAPPDAFSADGQNWGFPTYNWDEMAKDNYAWWRMRLRVMAKYFDAFRIDHILGFFRIWEIPVPEKSGMYGHFSPALPYSREEIESHGLPVYGLFIEHKGKFHPLIGAHRNPEYASLDDWHKAVFNHIYDDYFYHRHNEFWRDSAMRKLPTLLGCTPMLACGEDLGMIPACVPDVMKELGILSLEIERMPKNTGVDFGRTEDYPVNCVCTTSTHDMSPLRKWWKEESRELIQEYYNNVLGWQGEAPSDCTSEIAREIVRRHLASPAKLAILPLQDWLATSSDIEMPDCMTEQINIPAVSEHYWRYRMHITLEALLSSEKFNNSIARIINENYR